MNKIILASLLFFIGFINNNQAQSFATPVEYIEYFNEEFTNIQNLQIEYSAFLVHTGSDEAEAKRQDLLVTTQKVHDRFAKIVAYENDKGMKASAVKILDIMLEIGNKDYNKLASEKSGCLDCFATILGQNELTDKDSKEMGKLMKLLIKNLDDFAKENKVELTDNESANESLLGKINRINDYLRELDMVTLEMQYADNDIVTALNNKDIAKAKEEIKTMVKAVANASKRLKSVEKIKEDATTYGQAEKLIELYKEASKSIYPDMVSAFDKKGEIINEKVDLYNKSIQKLNSGAGSCYLKYLNAKQSLQERHIPKPQEKVKRS